MSSLQKEELTTFQKDSNRKFQRANDLIVNGVVLDAQFVQWGNIILLIEHEVVLHRLKVDRTLKWVITP